MDDRLLVRPPARLDHPLGQVEAGLSTLVVTRALVDTARRQDRTGLVMMSSVPTLELAPGTLRHVEVVVDGELVDVAVDEMQLDVLGRVGTVPAGWRNSIIIEKNPKPHIFLGNF